MNNGKTRSALYGIVGAYLLYQAYQLFQGRNDPDTTMTPAANTAFIILFILTGAALIVFALRLWKKSLDDKPGDDDKNDMK